jgi:hypothetical protein
MARIISHKALLVAIAVVLVLGLAALVGIGGCGGAATESVDKTYDGSANVSTTYAASATTAAPMAESRDSSVGAPAGDGADEAGQVGGGELTAELTAMQQASGQKIIMDAQVEIEVASGKFQNAFAQALLIADRFGGYIVSSSSQASGEESSIKSGTIAIRVPSTSFDNAVGDATKLGEVKNRQIQSQDVTGEYVDLQSRITNSKAHVQALLVLLAKGKTVDEILQVQQALTYAQQELEQLQGRQRYLDEHTSYSTLTLSLYEAGTVVTPPSQWGITQAVKDGLHNLVNAFNAIVRGLGVLVPVLIILMIIAYIVYRIWRSASRRQRERQAAQHQPYPQGWKGQAGSAASQADHASQANREAEKQD